MRVCRRGHEYTPENTYGIGSHAQCRECRKIARRERSAAERVGTPDTSPELTPAQLRRLKDALEDGVELEALAGRFAIPRHLLSKIKDTLSGSW